LAVTRHSGPNHGLNNGSSWRIGHKGHLHASFVNIKAKFANSESMWYWNQRLRFESKGIVP
jgi:hypothetical protein